MSFLPANFQLAALSAVDLAMYGADRRTDRRRLSMHYDPTPGAGT